MGAVKPWHWVIIAIVVLILFGAGKLPGFARSLGQSLRIFKAETKALKDDDTTATATPTAELQGVPAAPAPPAANAAVPVVAPVVLTDQHVQHAETAETPGSPPRADS
ncbi:MAG: Sec-independent protein translocase protein tatA/E [Frankiales bacterium]|nr:Sec-independent protein translocase protein tatA/E [Frankiales bacterium]